MLKSIFLIAVMSTSLFPLKVWAQEDTASDSDELQVIEGELEREASKKSNEAPGSAKSADSKDVTFSGLGTLAPFTEVSVIQKRYMRGDLGQAER